MPRNASGVYTLPVAAFVPGQTITSADTNSNNGDMATALTQSLASTGVTTMTGQLKLAEGGASAPSLAFGSDLDTGIYHVASGQFAFVSNSSLAMTINPDLSVDFAGAISVAGAVTFAGAITFGAPVSFAAGIDGQVDIATAGEPALILNRTENDTVNRTLAAYLMGNGSGLGVNLNAVGDGANGVDKLQWASSTGTDLLDIDPSSQIVTIPGFLLLTNYEDLTQIATPAAPAAGTNRLYANSAGRIAYQAPAGIENPLSMVLMSQQTLAGVSSFEVLVPSDALEIEVTLSNYLSSVTSTLATQFSVGGVYDTGSNYSAMFSGLTAAAGFSGVANSAATSISWIQTTTAQPGSRVFRILNPNNTGGTLGKFFMTDDGVVNTSDKSAPWRRGMGAYFGSTNPVDKFKFTVNTGTFNAIATVFKRV